jgi:hypothetical protein
MINATSGAAQNSDSKPDVHVERPGPVEMRDPVVRQELKRVTVWLGAILLVAAVILLAQPLLLIIAGIVFAAMLDGGTRLLGRVLPIGRGWRLAIVSLFAVASWSAPSGSPGCSWPARRRLSQLITVQAQRLIDLGAAYGVSPAKVEVDQFAQQAMSGLGRLTSARQSGARRADQHGHGPGDRYLHRDRAAALRARLRLDAAGRSARCRLPPMAAVGHTLRHLMFGRLLGMLVEGVATWALLALGGVPLAALLGL